MVITLTSATLSDAAISANASIIAVALASHPLSQQFGADTIQALAAISERSPQGADQPLCRPAAPAVSGGELAFLRDAVRTIEAAEIAGSADEFVASREAGR